jgi:hypothetical protein
MKTHYDPTNIDSVTEAMESYKNEGFQVSLTKMISTITRKNNPYNKYMKWHVETYIDKRLISSEWYKSKPEALRNLSKLTRPMPIGDNFSFHLIDIE